HVVDALALGVDVAFDPARPGLLRGVRIHEWNELRWRLLLLLRAASGPPFPGRLQRSRPNAATFCLGGPLLLLICPVAVSWPVERPSATNEQLLDAGAVGTVAVSCEAAIAVALDEFASCRRRRPEELVQGSRGLGSASVRLSRGIAACLR